MDVYTLYTLYTPTDHKSLHTLLHLLPAISCSPPSSLVARHTMLVCFVYYVGYYPTLPPFASISPIGPIGPISQIPPKFHLNTSDCTIGRPLDGLRKTSERSQIENWPLFRFALQRYDEHLPFSKQNREKKFRSCIFPISVTPKYTEYTKYT